MQEEIMPVIMCAPLSKYPEKPKDYSESIIVECPSCGQGMWLSIKKKTIINRIKTMKKEFIFECFDCLLKRAPETFANAVRVDI